MVLRSWSTSAPLPRSAFTTRGLPQLVPKEDEIRRVIQQMAEKRPCQWQIYTTIQLLSGKNVIVVAPTSMGKTLTILMPRFWDARVGIIITPLNGLGAQHAEESNKLGLKAIFVTKESVSSLKIEDLIDCRNIIVSPEVAKHPHMEALLRAMKTRGIHFAVIVDEGHLMEQWEQIRPEYGAIYELKHVVGDDATFHVLSATLTVADVNRIYRELGLRREETTLLRLSTNRENLITSVVPFRHPVSSFKDLEFLARLNPIKEAGKKTVIFFNSRDQAQFAARHLRRTLPHPLRNKVIYLHSGMDVAWRTRRGKDFNEGDIWIICTTTVFGTGLDIRGITRVIQFGAPLNIEFLVQHFGRGGRNILEAVQCILFVSKPLFDEEVQNKKERAEKRAKKKKVTNQTSSELTTPQNVEQAREEGEVESSSDDDTDGEGLGPLGPLGDVSEAEMAIPNPASNPNPASVASQSASGVSNLTGNNSANTSAVETKKSRKRGRQRAKQEPCPTIMEFVNARPADAPSNKNLPARKNCRRLPIREHFSDPDERVPSFLTCVDEEGELCPRCHPRGPHLCCDIHNPQFFEDIFQIMDQIPKAPRKPKAKKINSNYPPTEKDLQLRQSLLKWREDTADIRGGKDRLFGSDCIMSDAVVGRIVDGVHADIIRDGITLRDYIPWAFWPVYFDQVLTIVKQYMVRPPSALRPISTNVVTRQRRCGACTQLGHTAASKVCPKYVGRGKAGKQSSRNKEN